MERTLMNKDLIQKRFAKHLETYNENAKVQKKMAQKLISLLDKKEYKSILEIGCGTGLLTELVNQNITFSKYKANDIVEDCIGFITQINPNIDFVAGDIEEFIKTSDEKYDLIISNAAFQWVDDLEKFIEKLTQKLHPNGVLLFSTFGKENFREIFFISGKTLPYYSASEIETMFSKYNPTIEQEVHLLAFKTPKDILKHFQLTGVNSLEATSWTKSDMSKFERNYNNLCFHSPTLTYNPIYVKILKK